MTTLLMTHLHSAVGDWVTAILDSGHDTEDIVGDAIQLAIINLDNKDAEAFSRLSVFNLEGVLRKHHKTQSDILSLLDAHGLL